MNRTFSLDDPGTPEQEWREALRAKALPSLDLSPFRRLVVVSAHPDDETLGVGGLIAQAARAGRTVDVVVLTDGAASHPDSPTHSPEALRRIREQEVRHAIELLAPGASVRTLALPDGALADHLDDAVDAVVETIGLDGASTLLLSPWHLDRHPDHEAAAQACALASTRTDAHHLGYPVWAWHWSSVDEFPWESAVSVALHEDDQDRKVAALAAHTSQVEPLSDAPGDEVLLPDRVVRHVHRDVEVLLPQAPADDDALDALHGSNSDPWDVESSWYEQRKRAVTLGLLPRRHYGSVLEVGCSIGVLTADLAQRADRVVGIDSSTHAVQAARSRVPANATVHVMDTPNDWPSDRFDLVVLSEVGYFFSPGDWAALLARVEQSLTDDGEVLLCHWLPQPQGWPMTGEVVHAAALEQLCRGGRRVVAQYRDDSIRAEVVGPTPIEP